MRHNDWLDNLFDDDEPEDLDAPLTDAELIAYREAMDKLPPSTYQYPSEARYDNEPFITWRDRWQAAHPGKVYPFTREYYEGEPPF